MVAPLLATALSGCADPIPSYELRWTIVERESALDGSGDVDELTSVTQCSEHGIANVQAELFRDEDIEAIVQQQLELFNLVPDGVAADPPIDRSALFELPCSQWVDELRARGRTYLQVNTDVTQQALRDALDECDAFWRPLKREDNPDATPEQIDELVIAECGTFENPSSTVESRAEVLRTGRIESGVAAIDLSRLDRREWPCFPRRFDNPQALARGKELPFTGDVVMCLSGRTRTGSAFDTPDGTDLAGELPPPVASVTIEGIRLREGETELIERPDGGSFRLLAPKECADTIDNDKDGLVDEFDPGCRLAEGTGSEDFDLEVSLVSVDVEIFGGGQDFLCGTAELSAVRMFILDGAGQVLAADQRIGCQTGSFAFETQLLTELPDSGSAPFSLVVEGLDYTPAELDPESLPMPDPSPRVGPVAIDFQAAAGDLITQTVALGPDQWMPPLETEAAASYATPGCRAPNSDTLLFDTVTLEVRDENDAAVDPATWDNGGTPLTATGNIGTGPCANSGRLVGPPVVWGRRSARVTVGVGNETCYETEGFVELYPRGPASFQPLDLRRVVDGQGVPSPTCAECQVDADCTEETLVCRDRLCVPQEF